MPESPRGPGRPPEDRRALARAFVAKAMLGVPTTNALNERLAVDKSLRRILGWERPSQVPSEATFSCAFAEFARCDLPDKMHAALIARTLGGRIVGVIARDTTEIEAREKPVKNETNDKNDDPPPLDSAAPRASAVAREGDGQSPRRPGSNGRPTRTWIRTLPICPPRAMSATRKQQATRNLERLQTPSRRRLRPIRSRACRLGFPPRQSGGHSLDDHDQRPHRLSLRSDGCGPRTPPLFMTMERRSAICRSSIELRAQHEAKADGPEKSSA